MQVSLGILLAVQGSKKFFLNSTIWTSSLCICWQDFMYLGLQIFLLYFCVCVLVFLCVALSWPNSRLVMRPSFKYSWTRDISESGRSSRLRIPWWPSTCENCKFDMYMWCAKVLQWFMFWFSKEDFPFMFSSQNMDWWVENIGFSGFGKLYGHRDGWWQASNVWSCQCHHHCRSVSCNWNVGVLFSTTGWCYIDSNPLW